MPIQVGLGVSSSKDHIQALKEAATQARISLKGKVDIALVFSSSEFAHSTVYKTIKALINPEAIIGATGPGIIVSQGIFKHAIAILLISLPENTYYNAACITNMRDKSPQEAGEEFAEKLLYGFKDIRRDLAILFSDAPSLSIAGMIHGLQERIGKSFPLIGIAASEKSAPVKTNVIFDEGICQNSACGILLGGKFHFAIGVGQGWKPLGKYHRVTKSYGNVIYEIENMPAVKMYEEYFARSIAALRKDLNSISALYPLGVYLEPEKDYLLRNVIAIESDGSLTLRGEVPDNALIRLMIGTKESCLKVARDAAEQAMKGLTGRKLSFALVFSSASRYTLLGRDVHKELEIIRDRLGNDIPICGVYTYGEIGPMRSINYLGKTYFHNQSINIIAFGT
jgi:hypothetical protein